MTKTIIVDRDTMDLEAYNKLMKNASSGTIIRFSDGHKRIKIKRSSKNLRFAYAFYPEDKLVPGPLLTFRAFLERYKAACSRKARYMAAWVNGHAIRIEGYELYLVEDLGYGFVDLVDGYVPVDLNPWPVDLNA